MWISTIRLQSFSRASRRISSGKLPQFDRHLKVSSDRYAWVETKSWDLTFVWILSMVAMVTAKQNCSLVVLVLNPCEAFTRKTAVQKCVLPSYLLWVWILFLFVLHKICVASDFYLYLRWKAEVGSNAVWTFSGNPSILAVTVVPHMTLKYEIYCILVKSRAGMITFRMQQP